MGASVRARWGQRQRRCVRDVELVVVAWVKLAVAGPVEAAQGKAEAGATFRARVACVECGRLNGLDAEDEGGVEQFGSLLLLRMAKGGKHVRDACEMSEVGRRRPHEIGRKRERGREGESEREIRGLLSHQLSGEGILNFTMPLRARQQHPKTNDNGRWGDPTKRDRAIRLERE
eukprot:5245061-Pleurochrysis_carterae.AAC.2